MQMQKEQMKQLKETVLIIQQHRWMELVDYPQRFKKMRNNMAICNIVEPFLKSL